MGVNDLDSFQSTVSGCLGTEIAATVGVDSAGYIVEMDLSVSYADGVTATHTIDLSNFSDAGTVGKPHVQAPPAVGFHAPCVSGLACTAPNRLPVRHPGSHSTGSFGP